MKKEIEKKLNNNCQQSAISHQQSIINHPSSIINNQVHPKYGVMSYIFMESLIYMS